MRILHFMWGLPMGGSETMLVDIVNAQTAVGHDVHVVVANADLNPFVIEALVPSVSFRCIGRTPGSRNPWKLIELNRHIRAVSPHILHCHSQTGLSGLLPLRAKKVVTIHDTLQPFDRRLQNFDRVVAVSGWVREALIRSVPAVEPIVIENGIDAQQILIKNASTERPFRIVQVGRLDHAVKGQDTLLNAAAILVREYPDFDFHLDFIGAGPSSRYLINRCAALSLMQRVRILGEYSRKQIYSHLKDYALLVQPSRSEGFGLTVLEALAAGLPVLVSGLPSLINVIDGGKYGTSFTTGDPAHCAEMIRKIARESDTAYGEQWRAAARRYVNVNFGIERTAHRYLQQYQDLLEQ